MQRKIHIVLFLFACLWLSSCKQAILTVVTEVPALRASNIYSTDSVDNYLVQHKDSNKTMAEAYYEKGLDAEKSNPEKSIFYLKRAITLYPSFAYYKELGDFCSKSGKYEEACQVYGFIENDLTSYSDSRHENSTVHIEGKLDNSIYYEHLIASLSQSNAFINGEDEDIDLVAKNMGMTTNDLRIKVFADKRMSMDTNSTKYRNLVLNFFTDKQITSYMFRPSTIQYFLSTITDTVSIFDIDQVKSQLFDYATYNSMMERTNGAGPEDMQIADYFARYLPENRKDTNWMKAYSFEHAIKLNDKVTLIIYAIDTSEPECPVAMRHIYRQLITMDKTGRIIASAVVAFQSGENLQTLNFMHDRYFTTTFVRTWEKPYDKSDFDNYLVKTDVTGGRKYFEIHPDGTIAQVPHF